MTRLPVAIAVLTPFLAFSLWITGADGYFGFLPIVLDGRWGTQVGLDLFIAEMVAWGGLKQLGRRHDVPWVPYALATFATGSIAVLAFLVHVGLKRRATAT